MIPRYLDKTVEELIDDDPNYVIWMYEQGDTTVTLEQYGAAIDNMNRFWNTYDNDLQELDIDFDPE